MFLFYCAATEEISETSCRGRILVVHRAAFNQARQGEHADERILPAQAIANLNPFAPPLRVDAGGGFVVRPGRFEPEILLIYRRGKWDLPKGKRNDGESVQQCAVREVREELGISRLHVIAPLGQTVHGYREKGLFRVKSTYWFLMKTPEVRFTPEAGEDIERAEWVTYSGAIDVVGFQTLAHHMRAVKHLVFEHLDW